MIDPYALLVRVTSALSRAFYDVTHLRPAGQGDHIAGTTLVVANHPNALLDAVLVASSTSTQLSFLAKAPLFDSTIIGPIVRAVGALPVHRRQDGADTDKNSGTFDAVRERLRTGGVVAIFPEGRSIDTTQLLELRTGAARMVIDALESGAPHVDVVPIGIWFADKTRFRTEAATMRGTPLRITDASIDAKGLTERIEKALRSVTVNAASSHRIQLARQIVEFQRTEATHRAGAMARTARAIAAADATAVDELERLFARADWLGATASELGHLDAVRSANRLTDVAITAATVPGVVVGIVGGAPAFYATDRLARRFIKTPTDESMVKIGVGAVLYPLWGWISSRGLRSLGASRLGALAAVAGIWVLHLAARPSMASLRARWSAQRLAKRLTERESLGTELAELSAEITQRIEALDREPLEAS